MGWSKVDVKDIDFSDQENQAKRKKGKKAEPWYEDFGEGVGVSALELGYGIKDLAGMMTPENQATLDDWKQDAGESGWGTAGQVAGELGQLIVPGAVALKGVRAANLAGKAAKLASKMGKATKAGEKASTGIRMAGTAPVIAAEMGVGAGHGALKLPGEGETRGENAGKEAIGALVGAGAGKALGKLVQGVSKSKSGKALMDKGIPLTPGQASDNPIIEGLETMFEWMPIAARGTKKIQNEGKEAWGNMILKDTVPKGYADTITESGRAGYKQVQTAFNDAYKKAWSGVDEVPQKVLADVSKSIDNLNPANPIGYAAKVNPTDELAFKKIKRAVDKSRNLQAKNLVKADPRKIDRAIQKELSKAYKANNHGLATQLEALKAQYRGGLPGGVRKKLQKVDAHWDKKLTASEAVYAARKNKGVFTPTHLMNASGKVGGKDALNLGASPLFKGADEGMDTVEQLKGAEPFNWMRKIFSEFTPSPPFMRAAGRAILGDTAAQGALKKTPDALLDIINGGRLGAAVQGTTGGE